MNSKTTLDESNLDEIRKLLLERARQQNLTLADLSRAAGRNLSYIHQYVWKGAPKALPLAARVAVARALDLPEDALRAAGEPSVAAILHHADTDEPQAPGLSEPREIPVFSDDGVCDPAVAVEWVARPRSIVSGGTCIGLWISSERGRLMAGDLAYVRLSQPPRIGDTVAALGVDRRVLGIGTLLSVKDNMIQIQDGEPIPRSIPRERTQMGKVVAVRFS